MSFTRIAIAVSLCVAVSAPVAVLAQTAPYSQVIITTQLAAGVPAAVGTPVVTVTATTPVMYGVPNTNSPQVSYASNFSNDSRTVNFIPGSYSVTAAGSGFYFQYSPDCSGFTSLSGATKFCTITLSTTPPQSISPCTTTWYGSAGCAAPVVPYSGPYNSNQLTCNPNYQTVQAGQSATFTATGGTPGGYNWTTPNRTSLNVGPNLTTVFQNTGTQTVIVSNGVQNASCTVNVVASNGVPITYAGAASVLTNYVPAYLPNTGFGPQDSAVFAFALVLLLGAGIFFAPYVRKAITVALG